MLGIIRLEHLKPKPGQGESLGSGGVLLWYALITRWFQTRGPLLGGTYIISIVSQLRYADIPIIGVNPSRIDPRGVLCSR